MATPDFSDPCARFAALRDAYYLLISGAQESLVRYKGPNGEQEVRFTAGNAEKLRDEMIAAEAACSAATGAANTSRRYAIRAGSRRSTRVTDFWTAPAWWFRP